MATDATKSNLVRLNHRITEDERDLLTLITTLIRDESGKRLNQEQMIGFLIRRAAAEVGATKMLRSTRAVQST